MKKKKKNHPIISQAACVAVAALMQYFLMAAFCWMLVEGIYLYLFVVKVYNISSKMDRYHVVSWGNYYCCYFFTITIYCYYCLYNSDSVNLVHDSEKCFDFLLLFPCRFACHGGRHFTEHCYWKRWSTELYQ